MIYDLMRFIADKTEQGEKVALVTLVEKSSGVPGAAGQMMAVLKDGTSKGTIGGGKAEFEVIQQAVKAMEENRTIFQFEFDLNQGGYICGGRMKGFGNVLGYGRRLLLFGGGHVAQEIFPLAKSLGFHVIVVEEREELGKYFESAEYITCRMEEAGNYIIFDKDTYVVICTRGHKSDYEALCACMGKQRAYLGMIGSVNKVKSILDRMEKEGFSMEELAEIYAPIGLEIADGTPVEIAISIISEIMQVKNSGNLRNMRERLQL